MSEYAVFYKGDAKRISAAVRASEARDKSSIPSPAASGGDVWLVVKITGKISGQGGRYNGRVWATAATPSASGNLSAADLSTRSDADPGTDNCVVWNLTELGTSNQTLYSTSTTTFIIGKRSGIDNNGKIIIECNISIGIAPGTAKYQVYQMLTDTTAGWDYVRAHA